MRRFVSLGLSLVVVATSLAPIARAQEKTAVLGFSQEPDTFIGFEGGLYVTQVAANLIYKSLVAIDDQMRPFADLAAEVPTIENGGAAFVGEGADRHLETTFKLRNGVTWSDGQPLTASDVVFTYKLSLNEGFGVVNDLEQKYSDVVALDDNTVVFKMLSEREARAKGGDFADQHGPVVSPLYIYGLDFGTVYPSHLLDPIVSGDPQGSASGKDLTKSQYSRAPIGTGPYVLDSWDAGVQMTFKARNDFFRGKPPIDTIVIRGFEASKETLLAQREAGDLKTIGS